MTYHVYIWADGSEQYLFALSEPELAKIIEAHDTGAKNVSLPGEKLVRLEFFQQIRVFENILTFSKEQAIEFMKRGSGNPYMTYWKDDLLHRLGREVTKDLVQFGFGEKPRAGGLASAVNSATGLGLWDLLHPRLALVSRKLYEGGSFKEAAQAAFTEIDERVGRIMAAQPGIRKTGKDMMMAAFSEADPIIKLFPDENPDARMMQEGYRFIFAGVMLAIRNPKGHRNFTIEEQDAIELLFLASRLLRMLDEAVKS